MMFSMKVNIFKGITLPDAPRFGKVFGGQFIGQVIVKLFLLVKLEQLIIHCFILILYIYIIYMHIMLGKIAENTYIFYSIFDTLHYQ